MMNIGKVSIAIAVVVLLVSMRVLAGESEVKVIANKSVAATAVSQAEIQSVFLLDKDSLEGSPVQPVLEKSGSAHEVFLKKYIGRTDTALQAFYRSLVFSGKASMPKSFASDAEVVAYVAKTKGAVGYVGGDVALEGVKTLQVK